MSSKSFLLYEKRRHLAWDIFSGYAVNIKYNIKLQVGFIGIEKNDAEAALCE